MGRRGAENGPQRRGKWAAEAQKMGRRGAESAEKKWRKSAGEQAGGMLPRFAWKHGSRQIPYEIKVT